MKKNTSNEIVCIARLVAKEGQADNLLVVLKKLIKSSKSESGCVSYQLHRSVENPGIFTFVDKFKDQAAFDYHCETEHVKEAFDSVIPPLVDSIEITLHNEMHFE